MHIHRPFLFILAIFAVVQTSPTDTHAFVPIRPEKIGEMGWAIPQKAYFVRGCELAYIDYRALREDFKPLKWLSRAKIREIVLENACYISEWELKLRGIRISDVDFDPHKTRWIYHPPKHIRSALTSLKIGNKTYGLFGFKGPLMSPEASWSVDDQVHLYERLTGEKEVTLSDVQQLKIRFKDASLKLEERRIEYEVAILDQGKKLSAAYETWKKAEGPANEKKAKDFFDRVARKEDSKNYSMASRDFYEQERRTEFYRLCLNVLKARLEGTIPREYEMSTSLNMLRTLDYSNGTVKFSEAIAEVAKEKAATKVLEYSAKSGRDSWTTDSYWIVLYPFYVLGAGGSHERVANIGRQSDWRFDHQEGKLLPDSIVDVVGGAQYDASGALIDFERMRIRSPLVSPLLADEYGVEVAAENSMRAYLGGQKGAVQKFITQMSSSSRPYLDRVRGLHYRKWTKSIYNYRIKNILEKFKRPRGKSRDAELRSEFQTALRLGTYSFFPIALFAKSLSSRPDLASEWIEPLVATVIEWIQSSGKVGGSPLTEEMEGLWTKALFPMLIRHPKLMTKAIAVMEPQFPNLVEDAVREIPLILTPEQKSEISKINWELSIRMSALELKGPLTELEIPVDTHLTRAADGKLGVEVKISGPKMDEAKRQMTPEEFQRWLRGCQTVLEKIFELAQKKSSSL